MADKKYASKANRKLLRDRGIEAVIPEKSDHIANRKRRGSEGGRPPGFDKQAYNRRNVIERCFEAFKRWRAIATRYDKLAITYRGGAGRRGPCVENSLSRAQYCKSSLLALEYALSETDCRQLSSQKKTVVVVGQGYVGLPVAMRAVEVGYNVVGIDIDSNRTNSLQSGVSYVDDISDGQLKSALESGRYLATADYADTSGFDIAIITVPTPLRESLPDLTYIEQSAEILAGHLKVGATVVLESTTYPGTTEELLVPILEAGSGLVAGVDFYVGYSPERIDPGNKIWGFVETPKVVSGLNPESLRHVKQFYDDLVNRTVPVSSPKEAELTKLLENTFRHVNIALVNELAIFAHQLGVDVWESIDAASTKPFGYMKFTPGPGVGGHCLPVDPSYLSWQVRRTLGQSFRFVELANDVNAHMPDYVVQRAFEVLNDKSISMRGSNILVAGISYKKNTGDSREAPSIRIIELLQGFGATICAADPHVPDATWPKGVERVDLSVEQMDSVDLVILVTDHDQFPISVLSETSTSVLDTRNVLDRNQPNVRML